jgi:ATP synthase protein I
MGEDDLKARIDKARGDYETRHRPEGRSATHGAAGAALFHAFQLVASVLVGLGIGYAIDKFAGTGPWGMLIFLVFGVIAGFRSIIRSAQAMTAEAMRQSDGTGTEGSGQPPTGGAEKRDGS